MLCIMCGSPFNHPAGEEGQPLSGLMEGMQVVGEGMPPPQLPDGAPEVEQGKDGQVAGGQGPESAAPLPDGAGQVLAQVQQAITAQAEGLPGDTAGQQPLHPVNHL